MMLADPNDVAAWVYLVKAMGHNEIDAFERGTFARWSRESLGDLRRAIQQRRRELAG